jgi:uncharacterized protein with NRDE domain
MCLIAWNWQPDSPTPLLVLSNRDEYYARPARTLRQWPAAANGARILAGQDMQAGGTWLGVTLGGRFAAITNYRTSEQQRVGVASRGELVASFLQSDLDTKGFLEWLSKHAQNYNPFNLLVCDGAHLMGFESRSARTLVLQPGIGALSNAEFETPWPKLTQLKAKLKAQVGFNTTDNYSLVRLLHDTTIANDNELPTTGVPLKIEQALSATFVNTPGYGTRACSVVHMHRTHTEFYEEIFDESGMVGTSTYQFSRSFTALVAG